MTIHTDWDWCQFAVHGLRYADGNWRLQLTWQQKGLPVMEELLLVAGAEGKGMEPGNYLFVCDVVSHLIDQVLDKMVDPF